ncbi:hypothetical protein BKA80DRAFT_3585 [Phyllosticta citrichinensis]
MWENKNTTTGNFLGSRDSLALSNPPDLSSCRRNKLYQAFLRGCGGGCVASRAAGRLCKRLFTTGLRSKAQGSEAVPAWELRLSLRLDAEPQLQRQPLPETIKNQLKVTTGCIRMPHTTGRCFGRVTRSAACRTVLPFLRGTGRLPSPPKRRRLSRQQLVGLRRAAGIANTFSAPGDMIRTPMSRLAPTFPPVVVAG